MPSGTAGTPSSHTTDGTNATKSNVQRSNPSQTGTPSRVVGLSTQAPTDPVAPRSATPDSDPSAPSAPTLPATRPLQRSTTGRTRRMGLGVPTSVDIPSSAAQAAPQHSRPTPSTTSPTAPTAPTAPAATPATAAAVSAPSGHAPGTPSPT
ncbi:hypothetical protein PO613_18925, partial [Streptomyces heilongjiangensis]|nr:hypothetical protein [Streptomyces heilongjiangensis]